MINISTEMKGAIVGVLVLILFIVFMILVISDAEQIEKKEFFECTEKTQEQDLEWCYDKFIFD